MFLGDYVNVLKAHFCKSISNEDLLRLLFESVVAPLDLRNKKGDPFILDKATASKIMNGKQNAPRLIRDNVYEHAVLLGLVTFFEDNIVSELVPKREDLCFQLMELLRADPMISPQHLVEFQMLATPASTAAFLAETFTYVVMADIHVDGAGFPGTTPVDVAGEKKSGPDLVLRGICDGELSDSGVVEKLLSRPGLPFGALRGKLVGFFERAAAIHLDRSSDVFAYALGTPVKIGEEDRDLLMDLAKQFNLEIPDDFFDLGALTRHQFASVAYGEEGLQGPDEAKKKYGAICGILDTFDEMRRATPFLRSFEGVACLALALENRGAGFDEGVRVQITLPKASVLSPSDILQFEDDALDYMAYDCDFDAVFGISRGSSFLAYDSSCRKGFPAKMPPMRQFGFSDGAPDFGSIIPSLFDFDMVERKDDWQIEAEFDEITQHTAVAFPELILLKGYVPEVKYSIRSKHTPNVVSGSIGVEEER